MKIKESLGILILILLAFSFALISPTLINQATNVSIKENYSMGETLEGNFTLKLENVNPNALLKTNLGHSISLRDFLKNNSKPFACESFGCGDRYVNSSVGFESGILIPSRDYGFRVLENNLVNSISNLKFDLNLNFPEQSQVPISIRFFESNFYWRYQEPSENYTRFVSTGCFNPSEASTNDVSLTDNEICEKITNMPSTKRIKLGVNYTLLDGPGNPRIEVSISKDGGSLYDKKDNFTTPLVSGDYMGEVIIDYEEAIPSGDYTICVKKIAGERGVRISRQSLRENTCGYTPHSLFVKIPTYVGTNSKMSINLNELEEGGNIKLSAMNYLNINYGRNCSSGCILPIKVEGTVDGTNIEQISFDYNVGSLIQRNEIYNITKTPITENFNGTIKLEKADFEADFTGSKKLIVTLNETKLFEKNISVISIPMIIRSVFPTTIPAGIPVLFIADVFSASPITSYTWTFGDGTTRTTGSNSVTKAYENITTYNLNLKAINNASQTIEQNFSIITQSPENYLNSSWDRKNNNFNKLSAEIDALSIPFKTQIKAKIGIEGIRTELNSIASARTSATTSQQYLELALRILNLDVPQSIWIEEKTTEPFLTDFNKIDLSIINSLAGTTLTGEQYQRYISNWEMGNVNGTKERISLAILSEEGVKSNLATIYKINVRSNENSHLIIQSGTMESSRTLESAGNGKALSLEKNKQETLDLLSFESVSPAIYVSPSPSGIKIIDPKDIGPCNYNNICEDGEDWRNCRHDCRPWPIIIWFLVGIFIVTIIAYTFVQVQFKKKYELSLFNSKQELHNLVESIRNSQENKIADKEITDKLIKKGWSREQVDYAIKKSKGEKTRPYEIIPVGKIMAQFKGKPNNKNEKHNK
jgi:PKD repeat protein